MLRDALNAIGSGELQVTVHLTGEVGQKIPQAEVVAVNKDNGQAIRAAQPFTGREAHTIIGIGDGTWDIHISAADYTSRTEEMTYPNTCGRPPIFKYGAGRSSQSICRIS